MSLTRNEKAIKPNAKCPDNAAIFILIPFIITIKYITIIIEYMRTSLRVVNRIGVLLFWNEMEITL